MIGVIGLFSVLTGLGLIIVLFASVMSAIEGETITEEHEKRKFIPSKVHGVLDYLGGATLLALPFVLANYHWSETARWLAIGLGVGVLVYSLFTRFELGLLRILPMSVHLTLDFIVGAMLFGVSMVFLRVGVAHQEDHDTVRYILMGMGIFEMLAALLTQNWTSLPEPTPELDSHGAEAH